MLVVVRFMMTTSGSRGPVASDEAALDTSLGVATTVLPQTGISQYEHYQLEWTEEVLSRVVTLVIVMIFTLVGNTTLILTILCYPRQRRKRVNIFLVNLAVGDLMVCLFTMTTEILFVAFGSWVLGSFACKFIVYGQIVTLASATFLLTGMSIDRYQVLVQPLRSLAGRPRIWRKVLAGWLLAFLFAVPQLFIFVQTDEGLYPDGTVKHLCRSQGYTAKWQRKLYFTFLAAYILVIPFIIMSFCYINIIRVVWRRTDSGSDEPRLKVRFPHTRNRKACDRNGNGLVLARGTRRRSAMTQPGRLTIPKKLVSSSKRKVVKMTLSVIVGFLICWAPYFVVSLIRIYSDYKIKLKQGLVVAEIMALVHSALNPLLYGIFSSKVTTAAIWRLIKCTSKSGSLDRINEAVSEDDTTWAECHSLEQARSEYGGRWWRRLTCGRLPGMRDRKRYGDTASVTFYHELLPNGHVSRVPARPDTADDLTGQDRATLSLVFRNPHSENNADSVSAV